MMIGTLINTGTVLAGSTAGVLFGSRLNARVHETFGQVIALVTLLIGTKMAIKTENEAVVLGALLIGALIGETLNIEGGLEALSQYAEKRFHAASGNLSAALITPTLLYCIGPMTLMGCLSDGMTGDYTLLVTKSILDGFSSLAFAAALGWPVILSALLLFVIQGSVTLGATLFSRVLTPDMTRELFATGGVILLGMALRLAEIKRVRVANLLPALIIAPLIVWLLSRF
jgi:uncharacterized membrane protein YqgA involved in biofilm formation